MNRYRYLFSQLVRREMRRKYKGSTLGVAWYLINPLVLLGAYTLMFGFVFKLQTHPDFPIFLMVGLIAWTFFQQSLVAASESLIDQGALVRKVRFPREAIPASAVTVQLITFLAVLVLLAPLAIALRGSLKPALLLLPVLVILLFCLIVGFALIVSVLHAYFRDVGPVLTAALLPWFFITPIFFTPDGSIAFIKAHPVVGWLLTWANPLAPFIESLRSVLYSGTSPSAAQLLYCVVAAALSLAAGAAVFRRMEGDLAVVV